jgi:hypothetical protein
MRRTATFTLGIAIFVLFGGLLAGCDQSPTSVRDFEVQPDLQSPSALSFSLTGDPSVSFDVTYQGFDDHPTATGEGELSLEKESEEGTPKEGQQTWSASFGGQITGVSQRNIVVEGQSGSRSVSDTISVTISRFNIIREFTNDFFVAADFEDDARSFSGSGGTTVDLDTLNSVTDVASSGTAYMVVNSSPSGEATVSRRTSAAGADRFSFLIKPDMSTDFDLTLTFTEETGAGTTTHQVTVPVNSGSEWFRYQVGFDQVSSDFDPVAQRAGGDGPFVSVSMSTDKQVEFWVDELRFSDADGGVADIHDFEQTSQAYGPPFCPPDFGFTSDVADNSDGFNARTIEWDGSGPGCFGYNYGAINVDVDANDVLAVRVNAQPGSQLEAFLQVDDGSSFGTGSSVTKSLPTGGWQWVEFQIGNLGDAPSALRNPGISNVGFNVFPGSDIAIDDIRIEARD